MGDDLYPHSGGICLSMFDHPRRRSLSPDEEEVREIVRDFIRDVRREQALRQARSPVNKGGR